MWKPAAIIDVEPQEWELYRMPNVVREHTFDGVLDISMGSSVLLRAGENSRPVTIYNIIKDTQAKTTIIWYR